MPGAPKKCSRRLGVELFSLSNPKRVVGVEFFCFSNQKMLSGGGGGPYVMQIIFKLVEQKFPVILKTPQNLRARRYTPLTQMDNPPVDTIILDTILRVRAFE